MEPAENRKVGQIGERIREYEVVRWGRELPSSDTHKVVFRPPKILRPLRPTLPRCLLPAACCSCSLLISPVRSRAHFLQKEAQFLGLHPCQDTRCPASLPRGARRWRHHPSQGFQDAGLLPPQHNAVIAAFNLRAAFNLKTGLCPCAKQPHRD